MGTKQALEGIRVVDFSWQGVGPMTSRYLAQHGAEVIKIESEVRPDLMRMMRPAKDGVMGVNRSGFFEDFNYNKYGIRLNMKHEKGVEVAKKLIAKADVVLDNFSAGVMEKWGLGYEELTKIKPDIIMISMALMGQTGPHRKYRAHGMQLGVMAGIGGLVGWPDRKPVGSPNAYTDWVIPHFGAIAILAALAHRHKTGKGQYIDLAQREASLYTLETAVLDYTVNGRQITRNGNRLCHGLAAPHGVYKCKGDDRWCAIAVFSDEEWRAFCDVIGNTSWMTKPEFATPLARVTNADELDRLVESWTVQYPPEEVMVRMQAAGVAAGVVKNGKDMHEDSQLIHRNHLWVLEHPEMGKCTHTGPSFRLSKTPAVPARPAPCLGEHSDYIFSKVLGTSDEEFVNLITEGVID